MKDRIFAIMGPTASGKTALVAYESIGSSLQSCNSQDQVNLLVLTDVVISQNIADLQA